MSRCALFDINVLLDVLLDREPFSGPAAELWTFAEKREIVGCVSALSIPTCYDLLRRLTTHRKAMTGIKAIRDVFDVVALDAQLIDQAIDSGFADFEDAVQAYAAFRAGAECIVTRDPRGFKKSQVPVISPQAYLASLVDE